VGKSFKSFRAVLKFLSFSLMNYTSNSKIINIKKKTLTKVATKSYKPRTNFLTLIRDDRSISSNLKSIFSKNKRSEMFTTLRI